MSDVPEEKRGDILAKYDWDSTAKELDGLLCKLI
jgi:hypothetical protein